MPMLICQQSLIYRSCPMLPSETPVLIVGAGPTGLALAIMLQQAGVPHLLIEKTTERSALSRAAVVHAHTLEALDQLGVVHSLLQQGLKLDRFTFRDRGSELACIKFGGLPSRFAQLLMIPQNATEDILEQRLVDLGGKVWRGIELTGLRQDAVAAVATISDNGGQRDITARYVVGADGMHSMVRKAAQISYDGARYAESFALADVTIDWPEQRREVSLFLSAQGMLVVAPLPNGQFRLVAAVEPAQGYPSLPFMQSILDARGHSGSKVRIEALTWSSYFSIHHRLAQRYRNGRLLLMGDAAHVHSPAGGQGMNTGLVDAVTLGQLLNRVIAGRAPDGLLDHYQSLRRPAAAKVLSLAGRLTRIATLKSPVLQWARNVLLRAIGHSHRLKSTLALNLSGIARRRFAPDLTFQTADPQ
jgi:2-polyprenyl-6-methoxyphenol hydroxylase-like FAD-dependent oxidoreductase